MLEIYEIKKERYFISFTSLMVYFLDLQSALGKYKTWTPGPWTPFVDRVHGPLMFTTPKITEVNNNKIKHKIQ